MTAQITEILHYENQKMMMCSVPLYDYFYISKIEPKLRVDCTALWRGYVGTWEIVKNKLYLIGLEGYFENGEKVSLNSFFLGCSNRIFADWYSGKIRTPKGNLIDYKYGGFSSRYEQDLIFHVIKGQIISLEIIKNEIDYDDDEDIF